MKDDINLKENKGPMWESLEGDKGQDIWYNYTNLQNKRRNEKGKLL